MPHTRLLSFSFVHRHGCIAFAAADVAQVAGLWDLLICTAAFCHAGAAQGRWWGARRLTSSWGLRRCRWGEALSACRAFSVCPFHGLQAAGGEELW